jgi:mannonate dehydratase
MNEMPRRSLLQLGGAGLVGLVTSRELAAQQAVAQATRATPAPHINDISVIETAPAGVRLTVVKITTDQAGLYGYGCATFTQRADLVKPAVERYLKPLLLGKATDRIEDIWQLSYFSSYWKNGPVLNNAISGVDQALWDIKGRQAGMPVYQLLGGKCREAVDCYAHASGGEIQQAIDSAKAYIAQGFRNVRVQVGVPGMEGYGAGGSGTAAQTGLGGGPIFEPAYYIRRALKLFEECRKQLGDEIELCNSARTRRNSSSSSWRIRCHPRTSRTSARFVSSAPRPSRWGSCSTVRTNGRRSLPNA